MGQLHRDSSPNTTTKHSSSYVAEISIQEQICSNYLSTDSTSRCETKEDLKLFNLPFLHDYMELFHSIVNEAFWRPRSYLETGHPGGALDKNDPGQQEEEGVGDQAVDRLSIQQQVTEQSFRLCLRGRSSQVHLEKRSEQICPHRHSEYFTKLLQKSGHA